MTGGDTSSPTIMADEVKINSKWKVDSVRVLPIDRCATFSSLASEQGLYWKHADCPRARSKP